MFTALALLLAGLVSGAVSLIGVGVNHKSQQETNEANAEAVRETNEANLQAVRETNAANVEQANIAYQRSLPVNQVNDLMSAGMSRAGALQKLAGGGSYAAPVLQSATAQAPQAQAPQMDLSKIGDIIERMGNIPSNVEQAELVRTQIDAAKADAEYKRAEEQRRQEQHDMQMDRERYDKWTRESMDSFFSKMQSAATEKNIHPGENDSFEQYVRKLGLSGDNDYKKLPVSAHERIFERYKAAQQEKREQGSSADAHAAAIQSLLQSKEDYQNSVKEHKTADIERNLRELRARADIILAEDDLSLAQNAHDLDFNEDGSLKFSRKVSERAKRAWNRLADTIGVGVLRDIIKGIVTVSG